jgi:hypothetical protein
VKKLQKDLNVLLISNLLNEVTHIFSTLQDNSEWAIYIDTYISINELVPRPEESYRLWCVSNLCDIETSTKRGGPGPYRAVEP